MKKILFVILVILIITGCKLPIGTPDGIPEGSELIKGVNDPVTIAWDYIPEEGVTEYAFEFLMCDVNVASRLENNINVIAATVDYSYTFTVAELNVPSNIVYVLGVRAVENGVFSSAIWSDLSADTAGGTFYINADGLWRFNAPHNLIVQ